MNDQGLIMVCRKLMVFVVAVNKLVCVDEGLMVAEHIQIAEKKVFN